LHDHLLLFVSIIRMTHAYTHPKLQLRRALSPIADPKMVMGPSTAPAHFPGALTPITKNARQLNTIFP
jgi:hypothetical protein